MYNIDNNQYLEKSMRQKAFTLAEIMIVLLVIGVLTAILLPSAWHSMPDENVMKFKKANATLYRVINELVNSEQYYKDGDLGIRANGTLIDGTHSGDVTYFCQTIADVVSAKSVNCSEIKVGNYDEGTKDISNDVPWINSHSYAYTVQGAGEFLDNQCKKYAKSTGEEIVTSDGVVFYQVGPAMTYGMNETQARHALNDSRYCQNPEEQAHCNEKRFFIYFKDSQGFPTVHKIFCIDVDGISQNATVDDCINECPFGYGIRVDGKIVSGKRANEWLKKSIQEKD